ncbi:DUF2017 domain-containing protein [Kitasatospora aureofaciens]|uniref:Uncharacterized protein n=1 Tax=Kitasatospora aureofaciens TaxID=1894 RepID=A0A1E7NC73_KITAU|nr:DUF2017 domain-containing protein [Kitasatospora aureofaciens]QEV01436.1 DUF2017 domain-containing protein [Streptomyces viridifaciens]ARF80192.1 hypothetical protein B6264_15865 [Kitasatospora aureofaciens]OEV38290.1 hypothetical protein HS99_0022405 [Kitasatospora aureofaciens]UKZ07829.1 DUF2017 domain-containing protein [Streptomyces viridifaciens]GGU97429.1 hypothetical protein GCM10010502_59540 [Kitasatospora aureofaciens]
MAGLFESAGGGGAAIALDEVEASILRSLEVQMLELIGPGPGGDDGDDPLAALFAEGPSEAPADPALARLFPDAYGGPAAPQDEETRAAAAEFRRYTELDLRARKRDDALQVVRALDGLGGAGVLKLAAADCLHWLGALNDLRLTLGVRLEVSEEDEQGLYELPDGDERKPLVMAYLWLGALQESLLEAITD